MYKTEQNTIYLTPLKLHKTKSMLQDMSEHNMTLVSSNKKNP